MDRYSLLFAWNGVISHNIVPPADKCAHSKYICHELKDYAFCPILHNDNFLYKLSLALNALTFFKFSGKIQSIQNIH